MRRGKEPRAAGGGKESKMINLLDEGTVVKRIINQLQERSSGGESRLVVAGSTRPSGGKLANK